MRILTLLVTPLFMLNTATADTLPSQQFSSSIEQTATIELYTSHGCSSCPPADKWLRQFVEHPDLWSGVIPIAFHVDYWDYLGWDDQFASADYSRRQRNYATTPNLNSVYTPGILVKGNEWRGFFRRTEPNLSPGDAVGILKLSLTGETADIVFQPHITGIKQLQQPLMATIAILGFGIESPIGAGENRGKKLVEDFVVLGHRQSDPQHEYNWQVKLPETVTADTTRRAIVAWVSGINPAPVQTTGGWLKIES